MASLRMSKKYEPNLDPAYLQRNVQSLSGIGGLYDFLALHVQHLHRDILEPYQLATGSKSALELLEEKRRRQAETQTRTKEETNAQTGNTRT